MEYGIYAAIFILLLGAVALVVWGTRKTGSKEQVMTSLDKLEAYDSQAFRRAELDQPASQRIFAPAVRSLSGVARGITPSGRIRKLERKIEIGRPAREPRCQRAAGPQVRVAGLWTGGAGGAGGLSRCCRCSGS